MGEVIDLPGANRPDPPADVELGDESAETQAQQRLVDVLEWLVGEAKAGRLQWHPLVMRGDDENG